MDRWPSRPGQAELRAVAATTPGFAGADLKAVCGGAVVQAARRALKGADQAAKAAVADHLQVTTSQVKHKIPATVVAGYTVLGMGSGQGSWCCAL